MRVRIVSTAAVALLILGLVSCRTSTEGEAVGVTLQPAAVEVAPSASVDFEATVTGTSDTGVTWSATGGTFVVHASGVEMTYTAHDVEGDYEVTATSTADPSVSATAAVHIVAAAEQVVVTIDPSDVEVMLNRSRDFTAMITGTTDMGVTWTTIGGTISGSGATIGYTAPSILGVYSLTATSTVDPGAHATATVHVVAYPGQAWASQYSSDMDDVVSAIAVDSADNVVIAGTTNGALFPVPQGGYDAFVAKIAADGTPLWGFQYGTADYDYADALAVDSGDNILLAGHTFGDLFGTNAGSGDAFVVKISPAGVPLWVVQHGTPGMDMAYAVAVDGADNVILGGFTGGDLFAPTEGGYDAFIAKMTPGGLPLWGFQYGTSESEAVEGLAVDSADNVVLAGFTSGDLFAPNQGVYDAFIAKVTPTGVPISAVQYGTVGDDYVRAVAVDSSDAVVLAGSSEGALFAPNLGDEGAFVAKVAADGTPQWAVQHGSSGYDAVAALAVDGVDNVLMGGHSDGDLFAVNNGSFDIVFAEVGPDGAPLRQVQSGSTSRDVIDAMAVDGAGRIVLAGHTWGEVAGPNQGSVDAFVIVLGP